MWEQLLKAISNNDLILVDHMLNRMKPNDLVRDSISLTTWGNSPLQLAIYSCGGLEEMVGRLLVKNPNLVNVVGCNNQSPLYDAVYQNNEVIVDKILAKNPNNFGVLTKEEGKSVIHLAVENAAYYKKYLILDKILAKNPNINIVSRDDNDSVLHLAIRSYDDIIIDKILAKNPSLNVINKSGHTPLYEAIHYNSKVTLKKILTKNPSLIHSLVESNRKNTPLLEACQSIFESASGGILDEILTHNPNLNAVDFSGYTSLFWAVYNQSYVAVDKLLTKNPILINSTVNLHGDTALHIAATKSDDIMVDKLLSKNANINTVNKDGRTALHAAFIHGSYVEKKSIVIDKLIARNPALINAIDKEGQTALHLSVIYDDHESLIDKLIIKDPILINIVNKQGRTALHLAVIYNNHKIIDRLLKNDITQINIVDQEGKTALQLANNDAIKQKIIQVDKLKTLKIAQALQQKAQEVATANARLIAEQTAKNTAEQRAAAEKLRLEQALQQKAQEVATANARLTAEQTTKNAVEQRSAAEKLRLEQDLQRKTEELRATTEKLQTEQNLQRQAKEQRTTKKKLKAEQLLQKTAEEQKIADKKFQIKQEKLKAGEQKVILEQQLKEELAKALLKQNEELKALNSAGSDETLASNGNEPYYWYSIEDGANLLLAMRKEHLDYSQSSIANYGEEYAGVRENSSGIFLADPYYSSNFVNYLTDDINRITASENFAGKKAWAKMPTKLILPFISGMHWRNVKADIDYNTKTCQILFDDPYGQGAFPLNLKTMILANLKNQIQKLISIENKEPKFKLQEQSIIVDEKLIDQQGKGTNSWDCGPITFSNINDLVKHAATNSEAEVNYSIGASTKEDHELEITQTRAKHLASYSRVASSDFNNERLQALTKQVIQDRALHIEQVKELIASPEHKAIAEKIAALKPTYISILFELLEEQRDVYRVSNRRSNEETDYSIAELERAYEFVVKEIIEPSDAANQQKLTAQLSKEELIVQDTFQLIAEGNARIQGASEQSILIMGKTGTGKSTLAHLLANKPLKAVMEEESGDMHVEAINPLENIVISHQKTSETKIPGKVQIGRVSLWDCPGFKDTGGIAREIANSFYVKRLFETSKQLKFILAVSEASLAHRGVDLFAITDQFARTFNDLKALNGSASLVITQATPGKRPEQIKYVINQIIKQNQSLSEQTKEVLGYLLKSVHLFHTPMDEGELKESNLLQNINSSTSYLSSKSESAKLLANIAISNESIEYANKLLNTTVGTTKSMVEIITKAVKNANTCLQCGGANIFNNHYSQVKSWLPKEKIYGVEFLKKDHQADEYFLTLNQLSELLSIVQDSSSDASIAMLNLLDKFAEYTVGNAYAKMGQKQQLQDYMHVFKQQLEYIKFLGEVSGKKEEIQTVNNDLNHKLVEYRAILSNALKDGTTKIILNKTDDPLYYEQALVYLNQYPEEIQCLKNKALTFEHLGRIEEQKGIFEQALLHYLEAASLDRSLNTTYQKIGDLLFKAEIYKEAINYFKVIHNVKGVLACYKALTKLNPQDAAIKIEKSDYLVFIGYDQTTSGYHKAFYLSDDLSSKALAWGKIGRALESRGEKEKAKIYLDKAVSKNFYDYNAVNVEELKNKIASKDLTIKIEQIGPEINTENISAVSIVTPNVMPRAGVSAKAEHNKPSESSKVTKSEVEIEVVGKLKDMLVREDEYIKTLEEHVRLDKEMLSNEKQHADFLLEYIGRLEEKTASYEQKTIELTSELDKARESLDKQELIFKELENTLANLAGSSTNDSGSFERLSGILQKSQELHQLSLAGLDNNHDQELS